MFTAQALQIALVHLCFNVIGIVLFYPLPFMRWPIHMARALGDITSRYRLVKGIASRDFKPPGKNFIFILNNFLKNLELGAIYFGHNMVKTGSK
jgi:hypothetical protein